MAFVSTLCRLTMFTALFVANAAAAAAADFERLPLLQDWHGEVYQLDDGRSAEVYITRDAERGKYDFVRIDLVTGEQEVVLRSIPAMMFWRPLAVNDDYVVATARASRGLELQLVSRKTSRKIVSRTLRDYVAAAILENGKLRLLQTVDVLTPSETGKHEFPVPHTSTAVFDLPTLAFEGEIHGEPVNRWYPATSNPNSAMACHRGTITEIDYDLSAVVAAEIPRLEGFRHLCGLAAVREGDLIYAHLGEWNVGWHVAALDPATGQPRYITPLQKSAFNAMVARNGLLLLAQEGPANKQDRFIRVLDAATGRELNTLPIAASELFFAGDFLVTRFEERESKRRRYSIAIYRLDWRALREKGGSFEELRLAYSSALEVLAAGGSYYDAIAVMEKAPLHSAFASLDRLGPADRKMLARYALWMTLSFGREEQGRELLERLNNSGTTQLVGNDVIAAASKRAEALSPPPSPPRRDAEPAEGTLSRAISFSRQVRSVPLSDPPLFDGGRSFVAGRDQDVDGKRYVTLEVFDRRTLAWLKSVPLQESDGDGQQGISSIVLAGDRILVATGSRYPSPEEDRLFVLDRNTLEIRERHAFSNGPLLLSDGRLVLSCPPSRPPCQVFDPTTLKVEDIDFQLTPQPQLRPGPAFSLRDFIAFLQLQGSPPNELVGFSRKYALLEIPAQNANVGRFLLSDLDSGRTRALEVLHLPGPPWVRVAFSPDGASVVLRQDGTSGFAFSAIDPDSGVVRPLLRLDRGPGQRGHVTHAMSDRYLFVGIGPDLAVVDFESGKVVAFEAAFVKPRSAQEKNVRLEGLIVDGNRLLAIPYSGALQVLDLERLAELIEESDLLAQTQSVLDAALRSLD